MIDWLGNPIPAPKQRAQQNANPCLALYGAGPPGTTCSDCIHLRYNPQRSGKKYWKCGKRRLTNGRGSDHRKSWLACGRYQKRTEEYHGG